MAIACGVIVANIYYSQPLVGPIGHALRMPVRLSGLIVTLIQLGYAAGLLLVVPLSDVLENRRLVAVALTVAGVGLAGVAMSNSAATFLAASFRRGFRLGGGDGPGALGGASRTGCPARPGDR